MATPKRGLIHRYFFSKVILIQGNTCAQVFTNGSFTTVHLLDSKAKVAQALTKFADNVGIPNSLLSDGAPRIVGPRTEFMKEVSRLKIKLKRNEVFDRIIIMQPREESESSRSDGGIACQSVKCHPACGIMAWSMRPTS
jgi:hypothetical protein